MRSREPGHRARAAIVDLAGRVPETASSDLIAHMASRHMKRYLVFGVIWWGMVAYAVVRQIQSSRSWWLTSVVVACAVAWAVHALYKRRQDQTELAALHDWYRRLESV